MLRLFLICTGVFICGAISSQAADIGCDLIYNEQPNKHGIRWQPSADRDQKLWPSGARPKLGQSCRFGFISGRIVRDDYQKFLAFYRNHHPFLAGG
jgi:hypothetical protein